MTDHDWMEEAREIASQVVRRKGTGSGEPSMKELLAEFKALYPHYKDFLVWAWIPGPEEFEVCAKAYVIIDLTGDGEFPMLYEKHDKWSASAWTVNKKHPVYKRINGMCGGKVYLKERK